MDAHRAALTLLNHYFHNPRPDIRDDAIEMRDQFGFDLVPLGDRKNAWHPGWNTRDAVPLNDPATKMLGLRVGRFNHGLCVIDVDLKNPDPDGSTKSLRAFLELQRKHPELPDLIRSCGYCVESTTGGWHFYFMGDPAWSSVSSPLELKTNGTQIVIPPSRFNGKPYRVMRITDWQDGRPVLVPSREDDEIGPIPDLPVAIYQTTRVLTDPKDPKRRPLPALRASSDGLGRRYRDRASAERAYEELLHRVACTGPGNRFTPVQSVACSIIEFADALPHRDPVRDIEQNFSGDPDQLHDILGWAIEKHEKRHLKMVRVARHDPYTDTLFAKIKNKKRNAS